MKATTMRTGYGSRHFIFVLIVLFFSINAFSQTNRGIDLNGSSGHINLGTLNPSGNFSSGFTFECWVRWDAFNNWSRLFDFGNGSGNNNILLANQGTTNQLTLHVYQNSSQQALNSPVNMGTGQWYHVAVTQTSGGLATLYIDGVSVASATLQLPLNVSRSSNYFGRSNWADAYLDARMDEIRVWNVARTQTQIRQHMLKSVATNATGLVAYYNCNEGSGTELLNSCTNGGAGNGSVASGTTWVTPPTGFSANAVVLDGTDDHLRIGSPLSAGSSYTKEAWVYVTKSIALPNNIVSSQNAPFWIVESKLCAGNNGATADVVDPNNFTGNTWTHVAVTFDAGTNMMRLYRNGTLVHSNTSSSSYVNQTNYVGSWYNGSTPDAFLGGSIDEVRIWNVVRTQNEIEANMNKELNPANESSLVAYYTFNQGLGGGDNTGLITVLDQKGTANGTLFSMALTGSTSNYAAQNSNLTVLPVVFQSFSVVKQNKNIAVQWSTISEQNASHFLIEHSADGQRWSTLSTLNAAGNSSQTNHYSYVHTQPTKGKNYYRVQQKDIDGKSSYTAIRFVLVEETIKSFTVLNAAGRLEIESSAPTTISMISQDGRIIWTKQFSAGRHYTNVSGLAAGVYFLKAGETTEKIVLQ